MLAALACPVNAFTHPMDICQQQRDSIQPCVGGIAALAVSGSVDVHRAVVLEPVRSTMCGSRQWLNVVCASRASLCWYWYVWQLHLPLLVSLLFLPFSRFQLGSRSSSRVAACTAHDKQFSRSDTALLTIDRLQANTERQTIHGSLFGPAPCILAVQHCRPAFMECD